MKTDLTRFDFHALRFMNSETVQQMSAEEVGQFVLLMCTAWLGQKEASLPNNPTLLARYARVQQVSPLVMSCWKLGEDDRYRNPLLTEEWIAATGRAETRHEKAKKAAEARWNSEHPSSSAPSIPEAMLPDAPMPNHANANPMQINSIQTNANAIALGSSISSTHDFSNDNFIGSSYGHSKPKSTPFPEDQEDSLPMDLARLFYNSLKPVNQTDAPAIWETLWSADFRELLTFESEESIRSAILNFQKIPTLAKFYVRAKSFCENFERIKKQTKKITKKNPAHHTGGKSFLTDEKPGVFAGKVPSALDEPKHESGIGKKIAAIAKAVPAVVPPPTPKPAPKPEPPKRKKVSPKTVGAPSPCFAHGVGPCNETPWVDGCDGCEAVKSFVENYEEERTINVDEL